MKLDEDIKSVLDNTLDEHVQILRDAYQASIISLESFQDWVLSEFKKLGTTSGTFEVAGSELNEQQAFLQTYSDPLSIKKGPPNVYAHLNPDAADGVLFFAHADKSPMSFEYAKKIPRMLESGERFSGPGIADDVAGIAAMVSALKIYKSLKHASEQQILIASILGKQGGVFGSYGLMKRFGPLSSAVYLHPAESGGGLGELKIASNGLIEFSIYLEGKPPDSTEVHQAIFSKSAVSALDKAIFIYGRLLKWAETQSVRYRHNAVEDMADQSFAISLGKMQTGSDTEVFEIPLSCTMAGTLCFPPNARLKDVKDNFEKELTLIMASDSWLADGHWRLEYGDRIAESSEAKENSPFIQLSTEIVASFTGTLPSFFYGHSMSDIRYPLQYWKAQAYGIGPLSGDLGKPSEWVEKKEYFLSILILVELMRRTTENVNI
jgi:acetylornithine deacetylase/succinyl-diaminopimelate desuccinylase-like protein